MIPRPTFLGMAMGLLLLSRLSAAQADDANWPRFRGPHSNGASDNSALPTTWSATQNVLWKVDVPGRGWSSPIVCNGRVLLTTALNTAADAELRRGLYFGGEQKEPSPDVHQWKVLCLDLDTGRTLWERTAHEGPPASTHHIKNSLASETPVTDGQRVYALFGNLGVYCYDFDGQLLWQRAVEPKRTRLGWGTAASPLVHEGRLYLVNDNEEESYLLCLDAATGDELWRRPRDERTNWSTPYLWANDLRAELITTGANKARSYDLDGNLLWECGGLSSNTIPTPFARDGLLYVASGYVMDKRKPVLAIRPGASGDITLGEEETSNEFIVWSQPKAAPYNPSPLLYGDYFYSLLDGGLLSCFDARTGEKQYGPNRLPEGRSFTASPFAYRDRIFCINEYGDTYVVAAGPEFRLIGKNSLGEEEMAMASPAISGDKLLVRTVDHLWCLKEGARIEADATPAKEGDF